ncbi:hypothetical protein M8494_13155 [Serratia ureilytica]
MGSGEKISWGSVIGGVITVLAVSLLLSTLGTSLGFSIVDPTSDDPINGAGTTVVIWSAVSIIISLAAGALLPDVWLLMTALFMASWYGLRH